MQDDVGDDDYYPYIQPVLGDRIATGPVALSESDARRKKVWAFIIKKEIPKVITACGCLNDRNIYALTVIFLLLCNVIGCLFSMTICVKLLTNVEFLRWEGICAALTA